MQWFQVVATIPPEGLPTRLYSLPSSVLQLLSTLRLGVPLDGIASAIWYSSTSDIAMGGQFSMTKV